MSAPRRHDPGPPIGQYTVIGGRRRNGGHGTPSNLPHASNKFPNNDPRARNTDVINKKVITPKDIHHNGTAADRPHVEGQVITPKDIHHNGTVADRPHVELRTTSSWAATSSRDPSSTPPNQPLPHRRLFIDNNLTVLRGGEPVAGWLDDR